MAAGLSPRRTTTPLRIAVGAVGVVVLLFGAGLYSDVLGLTNHVTARGGALLVGLPVPGLEGPFDTGLRTEGLHDLTARWAVPAFVAALAVLVLGLLLWRRTVRRVVESWPRGGQGWAATGLLAAAGLAFLPVGEGQRLAVSSGVLAAGFVLIVVALGSGALARAGEAASRAAASLDGIAGRWTPLLLAAALSAAAALVAVAVFDRTPHVVDATSHLFQARTFGGGRLYLPSHPLADFFDVATIVNDGRWHSQYTPGHAVLLTVGSLVGAPWLVAPLLGAAFVLATYGLGKAMFDAPTGRLGALLLVLSPFVLLMYGSYYSHAGAAVCVSLALLGYVRFVDGGGRAWALLSGAAMGLCVLVRPLTALGCGLPVLVDALGHRRELRERGLLAACVQAAAVAAAFAALLLWYNRLVTGEWLGFGYGRAYGPGFGVAGGPSPLPTLGRVQLLSDALFATPVPSLLLVLPAFLGRRPHRWDWLLLAVPVGLLLVHAPVGYRDDEFGPRYLFEAVAPLTLLVARGLLGARELASRVRAHDPPAGAGRVRGAAAVAFACAVVLLWAPRFAYYGSPQWRWSVRPEVGEVVDRVGLSHAIVFVPTHPDHGNRRFEAVFLRNAPDPGDGDVVYARDLGDRNRELMAMYPERRAYRFDDGTLTELEGAP